MDPENGVVTWQPNGRALKLDKGDQVIKRKLEILDNHSQLEEGHEKL